MEKLKDSKGRPIESLYINKYGNIVLRKSRKGKKPLYESLGKVSVGVAKRMRDRKISEWLGEDKPIELKGQAKFHIFEDVWNKKYIPYKEKEVESENTIQAIKTAGNTYLLPYFGKKHVQTITEDAWQEFYSLVPEGRSLFNANKYMGNFLKYCYEHLKIIPSKPVIKLPAHRSEKGKHKSDVAVVIPKKEEILLQRLSGHGTDMRDLIIMGRFAAMRISEGVLLRWSDGKKKGHRNWVEFKDSGVLIHLNETKNKKPRHFYAPKMIETMLKRRADKLKDLSSYVFPLETNQGKRKRRQNFDKAWALVRKQVGIECRFHDLRHTYLTNAFKNPNIPHILVCEFAGLTLKEAQETYLHFNEDDTRVVSDLGWRKQ